MRILALTVPTLPLQLEVERAERDALRRDMQGAAESEFVGAATEGFFGADAGEIGCVVLLGNVREDQVARASIEDFGVGEEFADDCVRKMPGAAHHALLDVPGIRPDLQHFQVMIGFQNQEIGFAQMMLHEFGHVAQIGNDGDFFSVGAEGVSDGVCGIVRNGERGDFDIADYEFNSGADVFHAFDFCFRAVAVHLADFAVRWLGQVGGAFPVAGHLRERGAVVAVFVGDEDAVNFFGARAAERFEAPRHFLFADAGVNQECGAPRFEQRGVARAARRQNGYAKRDTLPPRRASAIACTRHRTGIMAKCWAAVNTKSRKPH